MKLDVKKRRVSKKNKISWRKHVNIEDVEEYLEDQRLEERMGKPLAVISDADLFDIDVNKEEVLSTKAQKRKQILNSSPKCYSMLQPHTQVPDPLIKRNHVRTKEERRDPMIKLKEAYRKDKGLLKVKEKHSIAGKMKYEKDKRKKSIDRFAADLWVGNDTNTDIDGIQKDEWISMPTKMHSLIWKGKVIKTVTKYNSKAKKKSPIAAIEPPHPGTSYNPSFKDHQELLSKIAEKETGLIKQEEHLRRVTGDMFKKVTAKQKDQNWLVEMSQGLPQKPGDEVQEAEEETDEIINARQAKTAAKQKTLKQKRKKKEQLVLLEAANKAKVEKRKIADLYKLRAIKTAIDKTEQKAQKMREKRQKVSTLKAKEPKRVGPMKYEDTDLEFNRPETISGNLVLMKKEGNLLADRFKSLQKRNLLAPSKLIIIRKKAKVKKYTRPGHKDDWKTTIAGLNSKSKKL